MSLRVPRVVKFGSDFSGLDTAAIALKRVGIPTHQVFASDTNAACRILLSAKHQPDTIHWYLWQAQHFGMHAALLRGRC